MSTKQLLLDTDSVPFCSPTAYPHGLLLPNSNSVPTCSPAACPLTYCRWTRTLLCLQIRTKNLSPALDLGAYAGLQMRVKGDGLRYKCTIRTTTDWDSIGYTK